MTKSKSAEHSESIQELGRVVAGAYSDNQSIRVAGLNRVRDVIRKKREGIAFDEVEKKKKEKDYAKTYQDTNLSKLLDTMLAKKMLTAGEHNYIAEILAISKESAKLETRYKKLMLAYVESELIYQEFLQHVRGVGAVMSAKMINYFGDCSKYEHVSSLWKHVGMHVVDGKAPRKKKGEKLDFNPKLRSFVWLIGDSFVKQRSPIYRDLYDREKTRQAELVKAGAENAPKSKLHADFRARRKMVKIFLAHYYLCARELTGQETGEPYVQSKLGHKDIIGWKQVVNANRELKEKIKVA